MSRGGVLVKNNDETYLGLLRDLKVLILKQKNIKSLDRRLSAWSKQYTNDLFMKNLLSYVFNSVPHAGFRQLKETYLHRVQSAIKSVKATRSAIKELVLKKIPRNGVVLVHADDPLVFYILEQAKKEKHFDILVLDSSKALITCLQKAKIGFHLFDDAAVRVAVKKADIVLLGCHGITRNRIIHTLGSELSAEIAYNQNIPVYVLAPAMVFTPDYRIPTPKIVRKKGFFHHQFGFEQVNPDLITGIISEIGIYDHASFITHLEAERPWLFTSSFS